MIPGSLRWLRRTISTVVPVVVGVVLAVFFLLRLVPGDPARMILGQNATTRAVEALHDKLGLNQPLYAQFGSFVATLFTRGDTGNSLIYGVPTRTLIIQKAPISLELVGLALLFSILIAVPLALLAARHKDGAADHLIRIIPTIGLGMPTFWVGLLLIVLFAVALHWFPVGGIGSTPLDPFRSLVLPALAVSLGLAPPLIRSLRSQLLDVFSADFVTTFQAARVPGRRILFGHILRNAALPTVTQLSVNIAYLIGGTLVVEQVFGINGLGSLLFSSISNRDFPVVQGIALYCAIMVVVVSLILDAVVYRLDPRTRVA